MAGYQTWGSSWATWLGTKPGGAAGQYGWVPNLGEQLDNVAGYQTWGAAGQHGWVPNLAEQPGNMAGYQTWGSSWATWLGTKPEE